MGKVFAILACILLLASCAAGPNPNRDTKVENGDTASFFQGLWHGIIIPVTTIINIFTPDVNVYETHNNGILYNLGFFLGISIILGGPASAARVARRRRD